MAKPLHLFLLVLFALLQSVAPLVHAHVDGRQAGLLAPALTALHGAESVQLQSYVEESESPAISVADQLQRDDRGAVLPLLALPRFAMAAQPMLLVQRPFVAIHATLLPRYQRPHPQAPPALS